MKITIAMGAFQPMPPQGYGAVERVWQGLAAQFALRGHEVTVVCKVAPGETARQVVGGVTYLRVSGFSRTRRTSLDLVRDLAYSLQILRMLPRADILVSNTFWLPVVAPRLRPSAGRVVVHVARAPRGQYWLYSRAARFDAVSRHVHERLVASFPAIAARVRTFPNPVDTQVLSPAVVPARKNHSTIIYLGRLHPEKGVHLLVEAFATVAASMCDACLRLIGPWRAQDGGGGEAYLDALRKSAAGLRIEFVGPIADPGAIAIAMRDADLFCYPSLAEQGEAFGLAPVEAMATGLVPVVSDLAPFRDFIEPGRNGIVFDHRGAGAAGNLARELLAALADPGRLATMSRAAVARASEFSYERVARMRLGDYEELLREAH